MKRSVSIMAASAAICAGANAQTAEFKTTCARGGDARVIEVVAPGEVGQSCDVRYTRGPDNVSVPYRADNSPPSYCNEKAQVLAKRLESAGFTCTAAAPALCAEARTESDYVVEAQRAAPAPAAPANPRPVVFEQAPAPLASNADDQGGALEDAMSEILAQPAADAAAGAPAQLVAQAAETPRVKPQPTPVGRLSGAAPDAPRAAITPTPAAANGLQDAEVAAPAERPAETALAQAVAPAAEKSPALRSPADVIRATLHAQAAAWNEGDLDGFMSGYWKSDDLRFVSGVDITRGWTATLKRYRERYADGEGLGQLAFDRLESKFITDDVAVVTGRFELVNNDESSSGVFSLVMRRDGGAWRIVHDHTSADPAAE